MAEQPADSAFVASPTLLNLRAGTRRRTTFSTGTTRLGACPSETLLEEFAQGQKLERARAVLRDGAGLDETRKRSTIPPVAGH